MDDMQPLCVQCGPDTWLFSDLREQFDIKYGVELLRDGDYYAALAQSNPLYQVSSSIGRETRARPFKEADQMQRVH